MKKGEERGCCSTGPITKLERDHEHARSNLLCAICCCCFFFCCSAGALACSRVARVSVCPQALLALSEQSQAFGCEILHFSLKRAHWQGPEVGQECPKERQPSPKVCPSERASNEGLVNMLHPIPSLSTCLLAHSLALATGRVGGKGGDCALFLF